MPRASTSAASNSGETFEVLHLLGDTKPVRKHVASVKTDVARGWVRSPAAHARTGLQSWREHPHLKVRMSTSGSSLETFGAKEFVECQLSLKVPVIGNGLVQQSCDSKH